MDSKIQKAAVCAAGAAVMTGTFLAAGDCFARLAMDREAPDLCKRIRRYRALHPENPEERGTAEFCGEQLKSRPHKKVTIRSFDGLKLEGHWFGQRDAERVIVAVHGWRSSWYRDFGAISDFWERNRCSVLYIEQRAHGGSEGKYIGFGLLERRDLMDWLSAVGEWCGKEIPVYLSGVSLGATTAMMVSDQQFPVNVCGITADCGFTSPDEICRYHLTHYFHLPYGSFVRYFQKCCKRKLGYPLDVFSTVTALKHCEVPVLFIHGEADHFVPIEMTRENCAACGGPKRILTVPGAGHGMSYLKDRDRYEAEEKKFWDFCEQNIKE